jgi:hypothetical protein
VKWNSFHFSCGISLTPFLLQFFSTLPGMQVASLWEVKHFGEVGMCACADTHSNTYSLRVLCSHNVHRGTTKQISSKSSRTPCTHRMLQFKLILSNPDTSGLILTCTWEFLFFQFLEVGWDRVHFVLWLPAPGDRWWVWSSRWNENWQGKPK